MHTKSLKKAVYFLKNGRPSKAAGICSAILNATPDNIDALHFLGITKAMNNDHIGAVACYKKALRYSPDAEGVLSNLGNSLTLLHRNEEAITHLEKALKLSPRYPEALNNLGNALRALERHEDAFICYKKALELNPNFPEALNNLGHALDKLNRPEEAILHLEKALKLRPNFGNAITKYAVLKREACDWRDFRELQRKLKKWVASSKEPLGPFVFLSYTDDPAEQLHCAKRYAEKIIGHPEQLPTLHAQKFSDTVRVAYLSADFHNHATAYLIAEMIEKHDRGKFEIHAFSFGPDKNDAMRKRLSNSFNEFHDVRNKSDFEVAELIRQLGIQIAVDLGGYTDGARPSILAQRPVPIQVNYLGFPGTMGVDYIDYIIVDRFIVPPDQQVFFTEKLVYMPTCYQVNDSQREIANNIPSRSACSLPDDGFVFCCFNRNYKITPVIFEIWMRLLNKTPGSVLWLLKDNDSAVRSLCNEAEKQGVKPERLIFAPRVDLSQHISRQKQADLFLDTFPYGAHTTASEALWAGLPVLTYAGRSFASRVAGSLLNAIGLPEFVQYSLKGYEEMALKLTEDPKLLESYRCRLLKNRESSHLFNGEQFTRCLEAAYIAMLQRWKDHGSPKPFSVSDMKR